MAHTNKVIHSVNLDGDFVCVDIFQRPDRTFGFDEFRRDPEDGRGWYSIGHYGSQVFADAETAILEARNSIGWFQDKQG